MMDEEEDDFYDPADSVPAGQVPTHADNEAAQQQTDGFEEEEEVEVEDDDVCSQAPKSHEVD